MGRLLELLQVDEVTDHFFRREVVEQAQHPLEQQAVFAAAELLGHDDAGVRARRRLPRLVQGGEIADVEGEDGPVCGRGEGELLLVSSGVLPGLLGRQHVVPAATQIDGQPGHDVAVEIQADEERFKAGGIGHGPALPER